MKLETKNKQRGERINFILLKIQEATQKGKLVSKEKLISEFCLRWGMTRRTMLEYLKLLICSGKIRQEKINDEITFHG